MKKYSHATTRRKQLAQAGMFGLFRAVTVLVVLILVGILAFVFFNGAPAISWEFLTTAPREGMTEGGIWPAIVGTFCLIVGSMLFAFPVGMLSGIWMQEYLGDSYLKRFIRIMTNNLAGVPSIVFGLFGMALFVNKLNFGASIVAGSLTLGLLALPIIIRTTEEAMKAIDPGLRIASLALGATRWQTISRVVLPAALPNVITGLILSIGRVAGETAPILFTVAAYFLRRLPNSVYDQVMALPYHLYVISTSGTDIEGSRKMAYGTALVLIVIVLLTNLMAMYIRRVYSRKNKGH